MPMLNPPHPGDFVRTEIIAPLRISVTAAAAALGVSRPALSTLLNSRAALSGEMAARIDKAFGVPMEILLQMQNAYDIAEARKKSGQIRVRKYRAKRSGRPSIAAKSPRQSRRPAR